MSDAVKERKWVPDYAVHSQNAYSRNATPARRAAGLEVVKDYCILHPALNVHEPQRDLEKKGPQINLQHSKQAEHSLYKRESP